MSAEALKLASLAVPAIPLEPISVQAPVRDEARVTAPTKPQPDIPAQQEQIRRAAELVGEAVSKMNHGIHYEIDESSNTIITKIIDRETNEVVRQIPAEEVLEVARRLRHYMGVLLDIEV